MKKISIFIAMAAIAVSCAAVSRAAGQGKTDPRKSRAAALMADIKKDLAKKSGVYLYFYADSYGTSINESARIEKIAKGEKAGFHLINVEDGELEAVSSIYNIEFVPTVLRLGRGAGVVEEFEGPKPVAALTAGRKRKNPPALAKQISENSKKGSATLLEFYAEWCSPCMKMMPLLKEAEEKSGGRLKVVRIHVDKDGDTLRMYNVDSPPANIVLDADGVPRLRTGAIPSPQLLLDVLKDMGVI